MVPANKHFRWTEDGKTSQIVIVLHGLSIMISLWTILFLLVLQYTGVVAQMRFRHETTLINIRQATDSSVDDGTDSNGSNENSPSAPASPSPPPESPLRSMFINTWKPGYTPITSVVYSENKLSSSFNSCTFETPNNSTSCFQDDAYNDRLSFQITFNTDSEKMNATFSSSPPEVETPSTITSIASPTVLARSMEERQDTIVITVEYNCKSNDNGFVPIQLKIHFGATSDDDLLIYWQKYCNNGVNDKLKYGYLTGDPDDGTAELHQFGQDTAALLTVGPSDVSTEFFLKLDQPGARQAFLAPFIVSTFSDIVTVKVRGNHPQGGILEGLNLNKFQISYECHRRGDATIEATIAIPPFRNISVTWKKDCGGSSASNLLVGSEENQFDIVDNGEPTPQYMVAIENIGTDHSEQHKHLPGNQSEWAFFVKNGDDLSRPESDTALHLGRIAATIEQPNILFALTPKVYEMSPRGWRETTTASYALEAGRSLKVSMPLICRNIGESRILITVPVLDYQELEFGLAKQCTHVGTSRKSSEFVLTVGNIFWSFILAIVLVLALFYIRRKRNLKAAGFSRVSLTDRARHCSCRACYGLYMAVGIATGVMAIY